MADDPRLIGTFIGWLFVLLLLAGLAHGQTHYEHWQSEDGWHGETHTDGRTTDWDAYGPNGQEQHCHREYVGDTAHVRCHH